MWKPALGIAAVIVVIAMSGCGASVEAGAARTAAPVETSAVPTSEATAAPIEMTDTQAPDVMTPWGEAGFESADAWFLASMDAVWQGERPSDAQLLGAAKLACEQLADGAKPDDVTVVTGDTGDAATNNRKVVDYAVITICP